MKSILSLSYILSACMLFMACQPDEFKSIGDPIIPMENIAGTWKLKKVVQSDMNAVEKGFPYRTLDITDVLPYDAVTLELSLANGAPGSYTISNADGLDLVGANSGQWSVDNLQAPKMLFFISNGDTTTVNFGKYPNVVNNYQLDLSITKIQEGSDPSKDKERVRYEYTFVH